LYNSPAGVIGQNVMITATSDADPTKWGTATITLVSPTPSITSASSTIFTVGDPGSFTIATTGFPVPSVSELGTLPNGVNFRDNHDGTATLSGTPTANAGSPFNITLTANNGLSPNATQNFTLAVKPAPQASFLYLDSTTKGNWQRNYGAEGYSLAGGNQSLPIYDHTFAVQNNLTYTWTTSTTDPRALQTGGGSGIAAVWYNQPGFSFDVNITTGTHQVTLYVLDWDSYGGVPRAETIQVVDAATGIPLNTQSISNFTTGLYLVWNVSGHVKINVTWTGGANAVVNGVFFGGT
jgi:hypothetical protein